MAGWRDRIPVVMAMLRAVYRATCRSLPRAAMHRLLPPPPVVRASARRRHRVSSATNVTENFPDRSFAILSGLRRSARQCFRVGTVPLAFDKPLLDVVLGDEGPDDIPDRGRHRHLLN